MVMLSKPLPLIAGLALLFAANAEAGSNLVNPTQPLSANEKLYEELAKLPPAERHQKIVEGAAKESGDFNLLHAIQGSLGVNHVALFRKAYPNLKVALSQLGSAEAEERVIAEERAGRHLTDVISSTELTEMTDVLEAGYAARYPTPAEQKILPRYKNFFDPHHRWLITHWSEQGMSFNTKLIPEAEGPKAWFDLCNPKFKGQHSYEPIRTRFNVFLREMLGEEKAIELMKCIGQNDPILMRGQSQRLQLMIAGDHAIQGINFFYLGTSLREKNGPDKVPFKAVYTAPVLASGAGCQITTATPNPYRSALYCDWNLDEEPQAFLRSQFRGAVTLPHPFIPDDAELVPLKPEPQDVVERMNSAWAKYVQKKG
jgi:ABC-type Fe3+ transport system substrate-binding protein